MCVCLLYYIKSFTEPYHRLCATPIVIRYFLVLPLGVYLQTLLLPVHRYTSVSGNLDVASQLSMAAVVFVAVVRTFALVAYAGHRLLCHRTKASAELDAEVVCMLTMNLGMCLAQDSEMRKNIFKI